MKKLFGFTLLLVTIGAIGQSDTTQIKFVQPSDSTAIGTADGIQ